MHSRLFSLVYTERALSFVYRGLEWFNHIDPAIVSHEGPGYELLITGHFYWGLRLRSIPNNVTSD